ncbi:type II secretion system protein F [Pusillimonas sp. T7-7]|uniref:type II secretion system F family protein n=1 Tax=Pusillimonas sp. (strain T7-7) TaxID=1007105 RepID=UPI0002084C51|nr:type II secretion system F family protein [Pusillimonas sp. T7-7]AEC18866.1 type II secretion system protein F [Pusillimonas sp. T7-7]
MSPMLRAFNAHSRRSAFKRDQRVNFYRSMELYLRAGARKLEALRKLNETYSKHLSMWQRAGNKLFMLLGGRKPIFRPVIAAVAETAWLRRSLPLDQALKEWLPPAELAILASGERSGNLINAFSMAGRFARQQGGMWMQIVGAFAYPLVLMLMIMGMLYFISDTMLPTMGIHSTAMFSTKTQIVLWAAMFVNQYWYLAIALPIVATCTIIGSLSRWKGTWRIKADRYPPWSIYRRTHGALFLYTFAVLQKSGIPIQTALASLAQNANPWLKTRISAAMYGVRQGYNLGTSFRNAGHDFPDWEALPVMETMGSLSGSDDALIEYAENWLEDTANQIQKFSRRLSAISMAWVAVCILLLALSVIEIIFLSFR